ncbi:MAG: Gfo/Idh/MocA family oxidoreductase [Erysipelotrichaceae bacterium]
MINVAVVGLGGIATRASQGVQYTDNAHLYMAVSRDINKAKAFADKLSIPSYGTFEQMLKDDRVDLVYLCTPNHLHYQQIVDCFNHGKHVLCEKPMVSSSKEIKALFALAKSHNCFLMEAEKTLFTPANLKLKSLLNAGIIGDVLHIQADYCYNIANLNFPKDHWPFMENHGGVLGDVGVYPIGFSLLMADQPIQHITGYKRHFQDFKVDFHANAIISFENKLSASITTSWLYDSLNRGSATIYGSKGNIFFPCYWKWNRFDVVIEGKTQTIEVLQDSEFSGQVQHAASCIEQGLCESPYFNEAMHLDFLEVIESLKYID